MASAYFTFPALLVIYVAQRAGDLSAALGQPRFAVLPKGKLSEAGAHA
jgi:hypothetical protein